MNYQLEVTDKDLPVPPISRDHSKKGKREKQQKEQNWERRPFITIKVVSSEYLLFTSKCS